MIGIDLIDASFRGRLFDFGRTVEVGWTAVEDEDDVMDGEGLRRRQWQAPPPPGEGIHELHVRHRLLLLLHGRHKD